MKHTAFSVMSEMNIMQITVSSFLLRMHLNPLPLFLERAKHYLNKPSTSCQSQRYTQHCKFERVAQWLINTKKFCKTSKSKALTTQRRWAEVLWFLLTTFKIVQVLRCRQQYICYAQRSKTFIERKKRPQRVVAFEKPLQRKISCCGCF